MPDSLSEFIEAPTTVALIFNDAPALRDMVNARPYLRLGKTCGRQVLVYTDAEGVRRLMIDLNTNEYNYLPKPMAPLGRQENIAAGIDAAQRQPFLNLTGQGVLIGIIDSGVDYTLPAFRYEDGSSKIQYLWDQTISGAYPEGYFYGTEFSGDQINAALQSDDPRALVPSADTRGHGTFLASVAAGRGPGEYIGAAPDADLIVVKLRPSDAYTRNFFFVPADKEEVYLTSDLMCGIQYVQDKAFQLKRPAVICIGLGSNFSSHFGYCMFENYVSSCCYRPGFVICTAAGNESTRRHHASGRIAKTGDTAKIEFRANPRGDIFLSIWILPSDKFSLAVTSPTGETVGRIPFKQNSRSISKLVMEAATVSVEYIYPTEEIGMQLCIVKITQPTEGIWTVTLTGDQVVQGDYHAWLPSTGLIADGIEFLSPNPETTILMPSAAGGVVPVGAYDSQNNSLYANSSFGPTRLGIVVPAMAAPGVDVRGLYPGREGTMTGTSVAAAITAGASALLLQWAFVEQNMLQLNSFVARSLFIRGAVRDAGQTYPNNRWGFGKLNLINVFDQMKNK